MIQASFSLKKEKEIYFLLKEEEKVKVVALESGLMQSI